MNESQKNLVTPVAIVVAGGLIAAGLFFGVGGNQQVAVEPNAGGEVADTTSEIRPVTAEDHIKGSLDAQVKVVEYSDFECPFCKRFHTTMNEVMEEFGGTGEVAWVYRHFPLDQLHPRNARKAGVASECVAELGGNDAFWKFTDGYFEVSPANDQTNFDQVVPDLVAQAGVDKQAFDTCMASGKYDSHVQDDIDNAIATGGRGTPWSIVVAPNGTTFELSGSQPIESVMQIIEIAKKEQ